MRKRDREFFREVLREQRLLDDRRHREVMAGFRQMDEHFAEQREKLDEIIAEGKAGRAALFAILDRLQNGGAAA